VFQPEASPHTRVVEIDGVNAAVLSSVERVDISLRENEHDHATVILAGIGAASVTSYVDRLIRIQIILPDGSSHTFAGSIVSVTPTHKVRDGRANGSLLQEATLSCLGASASMRGKRTRVWQDFSVKDMVSELAIAYQFSYSCPDNTSTIASMSQRGTSDWEALTKACKMSGLAVNIHGTEIHVWDPMSALKHGAPSGVIQTVGTASFSGGPGRIIEFNGEFGTSHAFGDMTAKSISVLDSDGQLLSVSSSDLLNASPPAGNTITSPLNDSYGADAQSVFAAQRQLKASRAYDNAYVAKVITTGVAGPVPGSALGVEGFNGEFDGLWLVRGMEMKTNRGHFLSEWELSRTTTGATYNNPVILNTYSPAPHPKLESGAWRASTRREHVYSSH
jgi:hypothetical protein